MKSIIKKITIGSCALAICAPFAIAEPEEDTERKGRRGGSERPAGATRGVRPAPPQTIEELKTRLAGNERFKTFFTKRFDENKNGELSDSELETALKSMKERGARGPRSRGDSPTKGEGPAKGKRRGGPRGEDKEPEADL